MWPGFYGLKLSLKLQPSLALILLVIVIGFRWLDYNQVFNLMCIRESWHVAFTFLKCSETFVVIFQQCISEKADLLHSLFWSALRYLLSYFSRNSVSSNKFQRSFSSIIVNYPVLILVPLKNLFTLPRNLL